METRASVRRMNHINRMVRGQERVVRGGFLVVAWNRDRSFFFFFFLWLKRTSVLLF